MIRKTWETVTDWRRLRMLLVPKTKWNTAQNSGLNPGTGGEVEKQQWQTGPRVPSVPLTSQNSCPFNVPFVECGQDLSFFLTEYSKVMRHYSSDYILLNRTLGFPAGSSGKEPTCQCRGHKRHGFNPWVRRIPWRRAWQPTPVFLPGESLGQRSLAGYSPWNHRVKHNLAFMQSLFIILMLLLLSHFSHVRLCATP